MNTLAARLLALVVLLVSTFVGGCMYGSQKAGTECALKEKTTQLATVTALGNVESKAGAAGGAVRLESAAHHTRIETQYIPIEKEVIRYVQTPVAARECLDADGMRIWTAANRGVADAGDAADGGYASLPGASGPGIGESGRPAGEPRSGSEGVPAMQSAPGGVSRLGERDAEKPQ